MKKKIRGKKYIYQKIEKSSTTCLGSGTEFSLISMRPRFHVYKYENVMTEFFIYTLAFSGCTS